FHQGFCVSTNEEDKRNLALFEQALQGVIKTQMTPVEAYSEVTTSFDLLAIARKPVQDLRSIAPMTWKECGRNAEGQLIERPVRLRDSTLGGMFPEGNADVFTFD